MAKKKKDLTTEEKLQALYKLQLIDSELKQIEILQGELPMEVADLEEEIGELSQRLDKNNHTLDELNNEIGSYTAKIKEAETFIERYTQQLDNVKNKKEFEALEKEIQMQELDIQLAEKRKKESVLKKDTKEQTIEAINDKIKAREENLQEKKSELEKIIKNTEKEEKSLRNKLDKARKNMPEGFLKDYDKIINRYKNKLAVVTVVRNACGGCFYQIPPQVQIEIELRKKVIVCEHCGRTLVDEDILKERKEEVTTNS